MPERTRGGSLPKSDTKLAHWRLRRGVTQQELARAIGIDVKVYRRVEKGDRVPPLDVLLNCAVALRVSLNDIVEDGWREWQVLDQRASSPPDPDELWGADADRRHVVAPERAVELRP
jgi:transcriptional regulator with XRE-family HTH domain